MATTTEEKSKQSRFCFQYFDEACEVGVENEKGDRIRKRKRPGRKPNPPSQQERREQNRLAQRNFREREQQRRQEREKQHKEYMDELTLLRQRLAIAEYEGNYLRGWILQLLLASIAQHGTVPQTWVDTRKHPIPYPTMFPIPPLSDIDEELQLPPMLQLVLNDEKQTIVELKEALEMADGSSISCPLVRRAHYARFRQQQYQQSQQQQVTTDTFLAPAPSAVTPCQYKSIQELLSTDIVSLNTDSQDVSRAFPSWKPNQSSNIPSQQRSKSMLAPSSSVSDNNKLSSEKKTTQQRKSTLSPKKQHRSSPPLSSSLSPISSQMDSDHVEKHLLNQLLPSLSSSSNNLPELSSSSNNLPELSSSPATTPPLDSTVMKTKQPVKSTTSESPTLKRPDDLSHMPTTQALHILRLQLKIGSLIGDRIQYALTPTALQRIIPHDIRIDYVPSGSIRDRMIVFQDYFDMDECFQLLCSHSMFVGGDIRDSRNWILDPCVTKKYWFFSHHLYDHNFDDCHVSEGFIDDLREWSIQQQQQHEQQQDEKSTQDTTSPTLPNFDSLPTPS